MDTSKEPLDGHPLYEKVRTIGKGARSFVQVARNKATGELVAIRFIPRGWDPSHSKYIIREILNHQELSLSKHPHIVEFKEVFLTSHYLAEVLEYVEGETLQNFLEKVGGKVIEGLARFIFQQLIIALDFCHRKGKINRDIKLSNILLSIAEGQLPLVKLCDFGFSKDTYRHSEPHSQVGTALFVAPEVMQNFNGGRYDGQAADVWACGVVAFIMLCGRHPYLRQEDSKLNEPQQMIKLFQRMMSGQAEFPPEVLPSLSPEGVDLLGKMLRTDPSSRATMADIQRHPWFLQALPEGAGLMNDLFLAEDAASLSPQSTSQIEALVGLAGRREDMMPTRVALPSGGGNSSLGGGSSVGGAGSAGGAMSAAAAARIGQSMPLPSAAAAAARTASLAGASGGGAGSGGGAAAPQAQQQQLQQQQQAAPTTSGMSGGGVTTGSMQGGAGASMIARSPSISTGGIGGAAAAGAGGASLGGMGSGGGGLGGTTGSGATGSIQPVAAPMMQPAVRPGVPVPVASNPSSQVVPPSRPMPSAPQPPTPNSHHLAGLQGGLGPGMNGGMGGPGRANSTTTTNSLGSQRALPTYPGGMGPGGGPGGAAAAVAQRADSYGGAMSMSQGGSPGGGMPGQQLPTASRGNPPGSAAMHMPVPTLPVPPPALPMPQLPQHGRPSVGSAGGGGAGSVGGGGSMGGGQGGGPATSTASMGAPPMLMSKGSGGVSMGGSPMQAQQGHMGGIGSPPGVTAHVQPMSAPYSGDRKRSMPDSPVPPHAGAVQAAAAAAQQYHASMGSGGGGPSHVPAPLDMIPDLDAMVMNMPEKDLLQAATVDLRQNLVMPPPPPQPPNQPRHNGGGGHVSRPLPPGLEPPPGTGGNSSLSSRAPGSVSSMSSGGGSMIAVPPPGQSPMLPMGGHHPAMPMGVGGPGPHGMGGSGSGSGPSRFGMAAHMGGHAHGHGGHMGGGGHGHMGGGHGHHGGGHMGGGPGGLRAMVAGSFREPPGQTELEKCLMNAMDATNTDSGAAGIIDAAPFLFEGPDDELPVVGSLSSFNPSFDWGSFNTMPLQQGYQSSRFTRICRDVSAMYSDSSRATSNNLPSPQAMQMAAQMEAFNMGSGASSGMMQGMGMGGSGTSTGGMGMASGGSGMNLPMGPPPPRHGMGSGQGQGLQQVPPSIAHGMVPMDL